MSQILPVPSQIERVARAIAYVHFNRKPMPHFKGDDREKHLLFLVNTYWRNHEEHARAAIAAFQAIPRVFDCGCLSQGACASPRCPRR